MRHEDGAEARGAGRHDVGLRAVADHPGVFGPDAEAPGGIGVCGRVLLADDVHLVEQVAQPRTHHLVPLLVVVALGEEHHPMAATQVGQRVRDVGEQFQALAAQRRNLRAKKRPQLMSDSPMPTCSQSTSSEAPKFSEP